MKKLFVGILMVCLMVGCVSTPVKTKKETEPKPEIKKRILKKAIVKNSNVAWWDNKKVAVEEAKKSGLPIYTLITDDENCPHCDKTENELLTDIRIITMLNEKFISVKIDIDDYDGKTSIIHGYPVHVFFKHDGKYIGRVMGFRPIEKFIEVLEQVVEMNDK